MSEEANTYETESMAEATIERTADLLPEMERRYGALHAILRRLSAGHEIEWWRIDLARRDLLAVIDVMRGEEDE